MKNFIFLKSLKKIQILIALCLGISSTSLASVQCVDLLSQEQKNSLPIGIWDGFFPSLNIVKESSVKNIIGRFNSKDSVVISAPFFYESLIKAGYDVVVADHPSVENAQRIFSHIQGKNPKYVIGLGGGVATDLAKAVGVNRSVYIYHTILSTNCISNNRTVLGDGFEAYSYVGATPKEIILSQKDLMDLPGIDRAFWTRAGIGDYIAEISAAMEDQLEPLVEKKIKKANHQQVISSDPKVWQTISWILKTRKKGLDLYDWNFMLKLSEILHRTSLEVIAAGTNAHRIGTEHLLYRALLHLKPELRTQGAPHGTITAVGALIVAKAYEKITGNAEFYRTLMNLHKKTGLPVNYTELKNLNIEKQDLLNCFELLAQTNPNHYLIVKFNTHELSTLLDEIFNSK